MEHTNAIPKLVLSKFLKLAYELHEVRGMPDLKDPHKDGVLDIYDFDVVITHLITKISAASQSKTSPRLLHARKTPVC